MNFHVLTLFPEMIENGLNTSILGRAAAKGLLSFEALNEIFLEIEKTRARIRANVNYDTSLEVLLLLIRNKYQIGK